MRFRLLHPPPHFPYLRNDSSCVLRIETESGDALLPGDITEVIETRLVREKHDALSSEIVIVPHHGSQTSSIPDFVAAVAPRFALIGAGHRNRFDLPREDVVARWEAVGAKVATTADAGAIRILLGARERAMPRSERQERTQLGREH